MIDNLDAGILDAAEEVEAAAPARAVPDGPVVRPVPNEVVAFTNLVTMKIRVVDLLSPLVEITTQGPMLPNDHTPFDIDVSTRIGTTKVRVELLDTRFTVRAGEFAVTAGDDDSVNFLKRGASSSTSVEFYVLRGLQTVAFNLGLRARTTNLDFYLDPKIENNG